MHQVIRAEGRVSIIVGSVLIAMGVLANITLVILAITLDLPWMLWLCLATILLFAGGWLNVWLGRRARLEISPEGFTWCGFLGPSRSLAWRDVAMILMPAPGSPRLLAAVAQLRDGRFVEIQATWHSPTSVFTLLATPDLGPARQALIDGHRSFLAQNGAR